MIANFSVGARPTNTKAVKIGLVDRHRTGYRQIVKTTGDQIPWTQSQSPQFGADDENGCRGAAWQSPLRVANDERSGFGNPIDRQGPKPLTIIQQRRIFETLGTERHDPEIGGRMIDHGGDHAPETDIEAHLYRHEHDGEDNSHDGRDQSKPVMKQVSGGKPELQ